MQLDYLSTTATFLDACVKLSAQGNPPLPLQRQPELMCQAVVEQACAGYVYHTCLSCQLS